MEKPGVVVVVVPFVAQGHLNQLLHLSRLISAYNLPLHIVTTATHGRQAKLRLHGWNPFSTSNIHFHEFQTPYVHYPPPDPNASIKFPSQLMPLFVSSSHLREPFSKLLSELSPKSKRVVVIHDYLMSTAVQEVVSIPNAEAYVFNSSSALVNVSDIWEGKGRPCLDDTETYMQLQNIPTIEGCITTEFLEIILSEGEICKKFNSGNLYDTSRVIEGKFLDLLAKEEGSGSSKHWALGPFNPVVITDDNKSNSERHKSLEWLDKQDENSVIFVSFGSTTSLTDEQIKELAIGLENSGQKFLWVLRDADKGDIFEGEVRRIQLPQGYEERMQGKGFVTREWAPQLEILAHPATGGFVSHCGWNSTMESITMGVPLATWPMHSDQPRNAMLVTEVLKTGVVVRDWDHRDELVTSLRIENVVRRLMDSDEGVELRKRAVELGENVRRSIEKGGVARMEMDLFIHHITR